MTIWCSVVRRISMAISAEVIVGGRLTLVRRGGRVSPSGDRTARLESVYVDGIKLSDIKSMTLKFAMTHAVRIGTGVTPYFHPDGCDSPVVSAFHFLTVCRCPGG